MLIGFAGLVVAGFACWWAYVAAQKSREAVGLTREALDVAKQSLSIQRAELETSPATTPITDDELFVLRLAEEAGPIDYGIYNIGAQSHFTKSVGKGTIVPVAVEPANQFFFEALESLNLSGLLLFDPNKRPQHSLTENGRVVLRRWRDRKIQRTVRFG